jgi:hypothetical protein
MGDAEIFFLAINESEICGSKSKNYVLRHYPAIKFSTTKAEIKVFH